MFFSSRCPCVIQLMKGDKLMQEVNIPGVIIKSELFPKHNCKENLRVTEETHSYVNES